MVKVGDFGLARRATGRFHTALNTWQWLPPEVIDPTSEGYDHHADIYSFGIILWEVAVGVGTVPFAEYESHARSTAVVKANIISGLRPTVPADVAAQVPCCVIQRRLSTSKFSGSAGAMMPQPAPRPATLSTVSGHSSVCRTWSRAGHRRTASNRLQRSRW